MVGIMVSRDLQISGNVDSERLHFNLEVTLALIIVLTAAMITNYANQY